MKSLFVLVLLLAGNAASACPDFTGRFRSFEGEIFRVFQTDCSNIRLFYQTDIMAPSVELNYVVDGRRRQDSLGIWWSALWSGDSLVRESWSAEVGEERVGDQAVWTMIVESGNPVILQQIVHPKDGSVVEEKKFRKTL